MTEDSFGFANFAPDVHRRGSARGMWAIARGYRRPFLLAILALAGAMVMKTSTYLLIRYFVDEVLIGDERGTMLILVPVAFVLLAAGQAGLTYVSGRLAARTAEGIVRRLRNFLFDHLQRLAFAFHDATTTGELVQKATSDVDAIRRFFAEHAVGFGRVAFMIIINLVALFVLHSRLAAVSVVFIPIVLAVSVYFFRRNYRSYERYQEQEARLTSTLQEHLAGIRVVRAFARAPFEISRWGEQNREKYRRGLHLVRQHSLYWPVTDLICSAQMLGGFLFGALLALQGDISVGTFLAYAGILIWIIWPVRDIGELIVQLSRGFVSYGRVAGVIREQPETLDVGMAMDAVRGSIEFDEVSFHYGSGEDVLHEVDFSCRPGEIIALLGPTGSGKTTLMSLLPRFYEPTGGEIRLDGRPLGDYPRALLRQTIGIVEQEPFLFSLSIRDNITYGVSREVSDGQVEAAAKAAAIHDIVLTFPEGYATLVGEKGVTLSGGQRQRLAIARTLLKDPRILILDDSTSSVDVETEAAIWKALDRLMRDRTTFIIAHRVSSLMRADQIFVFDHGRVVQHGTHAQLRADPGMYRDVYELQTLTDA